MKKCLQSYGEQLMFNCNYEIRYLPLFYDDVNSAVTYISDTLLNPKAADDLVDAIENAILERLPVCESFEPYHSRKERKYRYYRIYVKNYIIYYVVITDEGFEKIMEVRRLLYNGQNGEKII